MSGADSMRILMLTADYPPATWSGLGVAVEYQANALTDMGVEVHVLCKGQSAEGTGRPHVHSLNSPSFPISPEGFDCIHLHSLSLSELAFELRRRTGTPVIYTAHSLLALELGRTTAEAQLWSRLQLEVMRASDLVVFLTECERSAALVLVPEIASRSRVVGNGLPPAPFARRKIRNAPVVFAGRFARTKGIGLLEKMLPMLHQRWPGHFVLAGGHGDASCWDAIGRLRSSLRENMETPGWLSRSDLEVLLATAALVLVPSYYEPFGMVALEAMRMGAPVLAAQVGGLEETVRPGSGGRLVGSHSPKEWCDRAFEILGDRHLTELLEERGPRYIAEEFSSKKAAERLVREVYC